MVCLGLFFFFFSSRRRHTRFDCDWSSDVCSSDLQLAYEESIRVPLVIRDDALNLAQGSTDSHIVANIDFAPTFAEAGGVPAPGVEGSSLIPLLTQANPQWRSDLLVEHEQRVFKDSYPTFCAVRSPDFAYVAYGTGEEELYDV